MADLPLSIVIGTGEGWPHVRELVQSLGPDAHPLGAEVIVVDSSAQPPPEIYELGPSVRWVKHEASSVFALYAHGLRLAQGDVVATTEDHALPRPGWCAAILRAHAEHPEAAAIGGAIENGSPARLIDWASYFSTQGPHMAPLGNRRVDMTTNEANVSYKHWAIEGFDDNGGLGFMAILHHKRLVESGAILRVDDRMVVDHGEIGGFIAQTTIHFHNGRSIAGFHRQQGMQPGDWLRMVASLALPIPRTARTVLIGFQRGRLRRQVLLALPFTLWLEGWQGLGHLLGYLSGPGGSPAHLR